MSAPIPQIRPARPGDEAGLHEAHMRSIREVCVKAHGEEEVRGWGNRPLGNRWVDAILTQSVWAVELDGVIHGHAFLRIFEENGERRGHIHGLYLTPEVLGQGVGRRLADLMLEKARSEGVTRLTLESTLSAHEFYRNLGFVDTGPLARQEIGGYPVSYYPMEKRL